MKKLFLLSLGLVIAFAAIAANSYFTLDHVSHALDKSFNIGLPTLAMVVSAVDSTRARAAYERIQNIAGQLIGKFPKSAATSFVIQQDTLITEQPIANNSSNYTFPLSNKTLTGLNNPRRPLCKGVIDNDLFMAIGVRMMIDSRIEGQSNVKYQTFPNEAAFGGSGATVDDLWSLFNAQLTLQVDQVTYMNKLSTNLFTNVPPFNLIDSAGLITEPVNTVDGKRFVELDPYPLISGRLDNVLTMAVSLYNGWNGAADQEVYTNVENVISLEFIGFTIKNAYRFIQFFNGTMGVNDEGAEDAITQNS